VCVALLQVHVVRFSDHLRCSTSMSCEDVSYLYQLCFKCCVCILIYLFSNFDDAVKNCPTPKKTLLDMNILHRPLTKDYRASEARKMDNSRVNMKLHGLWRPHTAGVFVIMP